MIFDLFSILKTVSMALIRLLVLHVIIARITFLLEFITVIIDSFRLFLWRWTSPCFSIKMNTSFSLPRWPSISTWCCFTSTYSSICLLSLLSHCRWEHRWFHSTGVKWLDLLTWCSIIIQVIELGLEGKAWRNALLLNRIIIWWYLFEGRILINFLLNFCLFQTSLIIFIFNLLLSALFWLH